MHESKGGNLDPFRPILWGSKAASYYNYGKGKKDNLSLKTLPKTSEILGLFQADKNIQTALSFDPTTTFDPNEPINDFDLNKHDPRFVLPCLNQICKAGN